MHSPKITYVHSFCVDFNFENFAWIISQEQSEKEFRVDLFPSNLIKSSLVSFQREIKILTNVWSNLLTILKGKNHKND